MKASHKRFINLPHSQLICDFLCPLMTCCTNYSLNSFKTSCTTKKPACTYSTNSTSVKVLLKVRLHTTSASRHWLTDRPFCDSTLYNKEILLRRLFLDWISSLQWTLDLYSLEKWFPPKKIPCPFMIEFPMRLPFPSINFFTSKR